MCVLSVTLSLHTLRRSAWFFPWLLILIAEPVSLLPSLPLILFLCLIILNSPFPQLGLHKTKKFIFVGSPFKKSITFLLSLNNAGQKKGVIQVVSIGHLVLSISIPFFGFRYCLSILSQISHDQVCDLFDYHLLYRSSLIDKYELSFLSYHCFDNSFTIWGHIYLTE